MPEENQTTNTVSLTDYNEGDRISPENIPTLRPGQENSIKDDKTGAHLIVTASEWSHYMIHAVLYDYDNDLYAVAKRMKGKEAMSHAEASYTIKTIGHTYR